MSATVMPKLEPSDRPLSPGIFPHSPNRSLSEDGSSERVTIALSNTCDVSQSGVPDDDVKNCALNLSMRSSEWNDSEFPVLIREDNSFMNVSSSCGDSNAVDASVISESKNVLDMSVHSVDMSVHSMDMSGHSENVGYMLVKPENSGYIPVTHPENISSGTSNVSVKVENDSSEYVKAEPESNDVPDVPENINVSAILESSNAPDMRENSSVSDMLENSNVQNIPEKSNVQNIPEKSDLSDVPENSGLINIVDSPENNSVMDLSSNGETSDVVNVGDISENDDVIVTSTTQEDESTPVPAEQEVVDVESYQPCVVDLTCEEEDDVDVVAVVEPVIFIGTGHGRETRRRNRGYVNPAPQLEDLTDTIAQEPNDDSNNNNNNAVAQDEGNHNMWQMNNPPEIDLQNPNLTFGSLLAQVPIETVDDSQQQQQQQQQQQHQQQQQQQQPQQHQQHRHPPMLRTYRELRSSTRRRRHSRSRSRSPILFPMDLADDHPQMADFMMALEGIMHDANDWTLPPDEVPNQLPLNANQIVAEEHHQRVARIAARQPTPSPPPVEQPTISCLVCLDSIATINSSSRSLCSTVCGHVFCSACIEEVVKQRKQCPVCRKRLTKKQYHPLFI